MSHDSRKIAMVVAHSGFGDEEFLIPKGIFESVGLRVIAASNDHGEAVGKYGAVVQVDTIASHLHPHDYLAIVLVGGPGVAVFYNDGGLFRILQDFMLQRKVVAAICSAPVVLANAGLVADRKVTVFADDKDSVEAGGAYYTGRTVEVDGQIVTANGPGAAKEFAEEILKAIDWQRKGHEIRSSLRQQRKRF